MYTHLKERQYYEDLYDRLTVDYARDHIGYYDKFHNEFKAKLPKLIVLNGPLGIGKSTLANMYSERTPLALRLDIDEIRSNLGSWRENKEVSSKLSWDMAIEMGRVALQSGHDVVVAQIIRSDEQISRFEELAHYTDAKLCEILLFAPKGEAVQRFIDRGQSAGYELGYRPDGLIGRAGGISRVEEMYDEMMQFSLTRTDTQTLESRLGDPEGTYAAMIGLITESNA